MPRPAKRRLPVDSATAPVRSGVTIPVARAPRAYEHAKRIFDVWAATLGLLLGSGLIAAVAGAIKLDSPGPVLFRQERIGLGGRPFTLLKFRTMGVDADEGAHRQRVVERLEATAGATGASGAVWAPDPRDPRVTRVGRLLRASHLDELPQLVNVLRGEMSLVGPRPPIPYEVELYRDWQRRRLSVLPGLTGLWQISGWGRLTFEEGVRLDLEYVERRSLWLDVRIVALTALKPLRRLLRLR